MVTEQELIEVLSHPLLNLAQVQQLADLVRVGFISKETAYEILKRVHEAGPPRCSEEVLA